MKNIKLLRIPFFILLLVYFLYLVVSSTPAGWAAWGVHKAVPPLWLSSVEGTLWRGKAHSAQVDIGPASIPLGRVTWRLNPFSLLLLKPCVDFTTSLPGQTIEGEICQTLGGVTQVKNLNVDAPISVIQEINPINATGSISLQVIDAEFDNTAAITTLDARFSWQNGRAFVADSWLNLGSFAATAKQDSKGGVAAEVFDLEGDYKVDLAALWYPKPGWKVSGTIAPQEGAPTMVVEFLKIFGEEVNEGTYQVQWP